MVQGGVAKKDDFCSKYDEKQALSFGFIQESHLSWHSTSLVQPMTIPSPVSDQYESNSNTSPLQSTSIQKMSSLQAQREISDYADILSQIKSNTLSPVLYFFKQQLDCRSIISSCEESNKSIQETLRTLVRTKYFEYTRESNFEKAAIFSVLYVHCQCSIAEAICFLQHYSQSHLLNIGKSLMQDLKTSCSLYEPIGSNYQSYQVETKSQPAVKNSTLTLSSSSFTESTFNVKVVSIPHVAKALNHLFEAVFKLLADHAYVDQSFGLKSTLKLLSHSQSSVQTVANSMLGLFESVSLFHRVYTELATFQNKTKNPGSTQFRSIDTATQTNSISNNHFIYSEHQSYANTFDDDDGEINSLNLACLSTPGDWQLLMMALEEFVAISCITENYRKRIHRIYEDGFALMKENGHVFYNSELDSSYSPSSSSHSSPYSSTSIAGTNDHGNPTRHDIHDYVAEPLEFFSHLASLSEHYQNIEIYLVRNRMEILFNPNLTQPFLPHSKQMSSHYTTENTALKTKDSSGPTFETSNRMPSDNEASYHQANSIDFCYRTDEFFSLIQRSVERAISSNNVDIANHIIGRLSSIGHRMKILIHQHIKASLTESPSLLPNMPSLDQKASKLFKKNFTFLSPAFSSRFMGSSNSNQSWSKFRDSSDQFPPPVKDNRPNIEHACHFLEELQTCSLYFYKLYQDLSSKVNYYFKDKESCQMLQTALGPFETFSDIFSHTDEEIEYIIEHGGLEFDLNHYVNLYMNTNFELDELGFKEKEVNESWAFSFLNYLHTYLSSLKIRLSETLFDSILMHLAAKVSSKFEQVILLKRFTLLGALKLDSDIQRIIDFFSQSVIRCTTREKFLRLKQITTLLCLEKESEVLELWETNLELSDHEYFCDLITDMDSSHMNEILNHSTVKTSLNGWYLTADEVKQFMKRRNGWDIAVIDTLIF